MRFFSLTTAMATVALAGIATASGCGYLPSQMAGKPASTKPAEKPVTAAAAPAVKAHTSSCGTAARGYKQIPFADLYTTTDDPQHPFRAASNVPKKHDVVAYVWGYDNCSQRGSCANGDHFWLIQHGPDGDLTTWVVTPQYPRITVESTCKNQLKVGERFRFSFEGDKLVGFSKH